MDHQMRGKRFINDNEHRTEDHSSSLGHSYWFSLVYYVNLT